METRAHSEFGMKRELARAIIRHLTATEAVRPNTPASWARDRHETLRAEALSPRYYVTWCEQRGQLFFGLGVRRSSGGILDRYPGGFVRLDELGVGGLDWSDVNCAGGFA